MSDTPTTAVGEAPQRAMKPWHPLLVAVFPVLSLYSSNLYETSFVDLLAPLLAVLLFAALIWGVTRLIYEGWQRAAVATSMILVFFMGYGYIYGSAALAIRSLGDPVRISSSMIMFPWALALIAGIIGLRFWRYNAETATTLLNTFSFMFVAIALFSIGSSLVNHSERSTDSEDLAEYLTAEPIELQKPDEAPDVYYLVFDRYGGDETLKKHFHFDNTEFYTVLRQRGFYIAEESRANYPKTSISMASALNMRYHDQQITPAIYPKEVQFNRAARLLKGIGYRYLFLGNWHGPFRNSPLTDEKYNIRVLPSEFADSIYSTTPLNVVHPLKKHPSVVMKKLNIFQDMVTSPGPKFVHAHWLIPHPPWLFNRDGSVLTSADAASRSRRENYINQMVFTNHQILKMIDRIQATSKIPPVIVIQADEGPYLYDDDQDQPEVAKMNIRSRILSAFHLPGIEAEQVVAQDITPVNTFRLIFREYFAADIALLEDRAYWWEKSLDKGLPEYKVANSFVESTDLMNGKPSKAKTEQLGGL
jgi:hypothetical protein